MDRDSLQDSASPSLWCLSAVQRVPSPFATRTVILRLKYGSAMRVPLLSERYGGGTFLSAPVSSQSPSLCRSPVRRAPAPFLWLEIGVRLVELAVRGDRSLAFAFIVSR